MAILRDTLQKDPTLSLALAVVAASTCPLLLLDEGLTVIGASTTFAKAFDIDPAALVGEQLPQLGDGEWDAPQLRSLLTMTASGDADIEAYDFQLRRPGQPPRELVLHARKLSYDDSQPVRLLLAASDVTEARSDARRKDELARENGVLLREVRHRVANSLQIIASVLLQGARNTRSREARGELNSAHNRLMSVATLERHLAASSLGEVQMRDYLTKLCESIAASMISSPDLTLTVIADDSLLPADTSVSLGLIVTELTINALKHAYPGGRTGEIFVSFASSGGDWRLAVRDDGVGLQTGKQSPVGGLGTTIVRALAKQVNARVVTTDAAPGTVVSVEHNASGDAAADAHRHDVPAV